MKAIHAKVMRARPRYAPFDAIPPAAKMNPRTVDELLLFGVLSGRIQPTHDESSVHKAPRSVSAASFDPVQFMKECRP